MAVKTAPAQLEELSAAAVTRMRPFAVVWMVAVVVVSGLSVALKKPTLADYPGTMSDPIMRIMTYAALIGVLGYVLKVPVVVGFGPWIERKLRGDSRRVRLRHMFCREIRKNAMLGGALTAVYYMMFYGLVAYLSPAALASARACVIVPLSLIELHARVIRPPSSREAGRGARAVWWGRFASSGILTLVGAGIVVFDGGFKLFKEGGPVPLILLGLLLTVGNAVLAYAEYYEYNGVRDSKVAAPVYSMARVLYYALSSVAAVIIWGLYTGTFSVAWHTLLMCLNRWELVVPIAFVTALTDMSRMCVKVVIPATFMYMLLANSAMADVFIQSALKLKWPDVYDNVHAGWHTIVVAACGVSLIIIASLVYPHVKERASQDASAGDGRGKVVV